MKRHFLFVLLLLSIFALCACDKNDYNNAKALYDAGDYEQAKAIFEGLGDYEDSSDFVKQCDYQLADRLMNAGDYEAALAGFEELGDYKDSFALVAECKYNLGQAAMNSHDWEKAVNYFTDLNFENSELMLTDCQFMIALQESVSRRMEMYTKENTDGRSLVSSEFAYLEKFRNAKFFDKEIQKQARKYLSGLDDQKKSFNYEMYYEYQRDWNTGLVARYEALDTLYRKYDFMADNYQFVGEFINQLSYHQHWLKAFNELEEHGCEETKDMAYKKPYLTYYFKNNTEYRSDRVFNFSFWDKEHTTQVATTSVTVKDIQPYQEFVVRVYIPEIAQKGGTVNWDSYYDKIYVD